VTLAVIHVGDADQHSKSVSEKFDKGWKVKSTAQGKESRKGPLE
jgi:hypothetical protein